MFVHVIFMCGRLFNGGSTSVRVSKQTIKAKTVRHRPLGLISAGRDTRRVFDDGHTVAIRRVLCHGVCLCFGTIDRSVSTRQAVVLVCVDVGTSTVERSLFDINVRLMSET